MARQGRDLERLVALIEEAVGPEGAEVKSPDFIEDRVTGEKREVDVSIRMRVATSLVLIVVECRDRNSVQDVTWIEQVEQKSRDLKASKVIAVSAEGFSEAALKKAAFLGIETRRMDEISTSCLPLVCGSSFQTTPLELIGAGGAATLPECRGQHALAAGTRPRDEKSAPGSRRRYARRVACPTHSSVGRPTA